MTSIRHCVFAVIAAVALVSSMVAVEARAQVTIGGPDGITIGKDGVIIGGSGGVAIQKDAGSSPPLAGSPGTMGAPGAPAGGAGHAAIGTGQTFAALDLRGQSMHAYDLVGATFNGVDLRSSDFTGMDLRGVTFRATDLRGANLGGANLSGAVFEGSDFRSADLSRACLLGAVVKGSDWRNADVSGTYLVDAQLVGVNLAGANLGESVQQGPALCPGQAPPPAEMAARPEVTDAATIESALRTPGIGAIDLTVNFATDSDSIEGPARAQVFEIAKALNAPALRASRIVIEGHTDDTGANSYNLDLSYRRAIAVMRSLAGDYDVDSGRLSVQGFGESHPVAANDSEQGRALNRRVVLRNLDAG